MANKKASTYFHRLKNAVLIFVEKLILKPFIKEVEIHDTETTLLHILKNKCSVSRYGDGELNQSWSKYNIGFQQHNLELSKKLRDLLHNSTNAPNHIICLPFPYNETKHLTARAASFWIKLRIKHKLLYFKKLPRIQYFDTQCTRLYMDYADKSKTEHFFNIWKQIWHDQNVCIIEGVKSRLGVGNDLFNTARSLKRILVPEANAFNVYDKILNAAVENCSKTDLILLAIGPTATVLSFDLAKLGYWAIDIGHIDIEYEWFKMSAAKKTAINNKYVNEVAFKGSECILDGEYENSIIAKIEAE